MSPSRREPSDPSPAWPAPPPRRITRSAERADTRSARLFAAARRCFPDGVNSPVRAFRAVGGTPVFVGRGRGAYLHDADGRRYLDLVLSWGPLILGHARREVVHAVRAAVGRGLGFGAPTEIETRLARRVQSVFPTMELMRFVSSGTEATMSAVRLARAVTGRPALVKFAGCYHGHADAFLAAAGSGVATLGLPDSAGVPAAAVADTLIAPYNALDVVDELFSRRGQEIAAVIVEPVAANMGVVPPDAGFLAGLRALTRRHGAVLIFDEVLTGWRVHPRGAQHLYGIQPDLTCLGKVLGGGLPAAAYGGRRDLMEQVAPLGPVYQAGTLSGNPVAMTAGLATLEALTPASWRRAERWAAGAARALSRAAAGAGIPLVVQRVGTILTPFFIDRPVRNYADAKATAQRRYARLFHRLLDRGVYAPPSPFEAAFISTAHGPREMELFTRAVTAAFQDGAWETDR